MEQGEYAPEQGELEGAFACLPMQEWFIKKDLSNINHFNHSFLIRVDVAVDSLRLKAALEKLNKLHDMLRATYRDGTQCYRKESRIPDIRELDIRGKTDKAVFEELTSWQNRFDLEKGYLWQSGIIRGYDDGSERIFIAVHHFAFDAASWPILRKDLKKLYDGEEITAKTSSYRQWFKAVQEYGKAATTEEKRHWEEARAALEEHQAEWTQRTQDEECEPRFSRMEMSQEMIKALMRASITVCDGEVNELLLGGLAYALCEVSGHKSNWITMEKQGREAIDPRIDVSRTLGWFTTLYPLCLTVGKDIGTTISGIRETIRSVPHNGIGYGAIHGYDLLPKVFFNYLEDLGGVTEKTWPICFGEASGEGMSPDNRFGNIIEINGLSVGGQIRLGVESCMEEEDHQLLCEAFKRSLEAIAAYYRRHMWRNS